TAAFHVAGGSWTFTQLDTANPGFISNLWYRVKQRVTDELGNTPVITHADIHSGGVRIMIDKTLPVSVTTAPALSGTTAYLNGQVWTFAGTAGDGTGAGLAEVKLRVSRLDKDGNREWYYWLDPPFDAGYPSAFETPPDLGAPLDQWYKTLSEAQRAHFAEGYRYEVQAQAVDLAVNTAGQYTNYETAYTTATFIVDRTTPVIESVTFSTFSANYVYATALTSGTLHDPDTAGGGVTAGVEKVYFKIEDISGADHDPPAGYYWSGSTWTVAVSTLEASVHQTSWTVAQLQLPSTSYWSRWEEQPDGRRYRFTFWGRDRAGNSTAPGERYADLIFDSSAPSSAVLQPPGPDGAELDIVGVLSGTAVDYSTSAIRQVYISLQNRDNNNQGDCTSVVTRGKYWSGSGWDSTVPKWHPVTAYSDAGKTWQYDLPVTWDPDCYYVVRSSAADLSWNFQVDVSSRDFKYVASAAETKIQTPAGPDIKYYSALSRIS
ncbi:MAG TPA: hypothetical protein PKK31_11490, partial [Elusimicrobiales bacterium]|nr:hypothetical protein [Elusimicrobiales bacterium]